VKVSHVDTWIIRANETSLCSLGFFATAAASTATISIRSADRTGQRQARASASLEAICLAAIDDWQFVKISRSPTSVCSGNAVTCTYIDGHGIHGLCKCISFACFLRALIDKIEQTALHFLRRGCSLFHKRNLQAFESSKRITH